MMSPSNTRDRSIGIRTSKKIDLSSYKQLCMKYSINIPSYSYNTSSGDNAAVGGRVAVTSSTNDWYGNMQADKGYWTHYGEAYQVTNATLCANISNISTSSYVFVNFDARGYAYGASLTANVYQIYLIPN